MAASGNFPSVQRFHPKGETIEAIQFLGWASANEISEWTSGKVFYVPLGYEHDWRATKEFDRSNGSVLDNAPPFLILFVEGGPIRVDLYSFIVKGVDTYYALEHTEINRKYDEIKD